MSNQDLKEIKKMLGAIIENARFDKDNQLGVHWIGGYAHGLTEKGDHYIALYPASDKLDIKVCRVYDRSFKKLPPFIDIDNDLSMGGELAAPTPSKKVLDKSEAIARNLYARCPRFKILTVNGKLTNFGYTRSFYDTLWYPSNERQSVQRTPDGGGDPWSFVSGGDCPIPFRPLFSRYENEEEKRPFSLDQLKEWYQRNSA